MIKDDGSVIHFTNPKGESNIPLSFCQVGGNAPKGRCTARH